MSTIYRGCVLALCVAMLFAVTRSYAANCTTGCKIIESYFGSSSCFHYDPVACSMNIVKVDTPDGGDCTSDDTMPNTHKFYHSCTCCEEVCDVGQRTGLREATEGCCSTYAWIDWRECFGGEYN